MGPRLQMLVRKRWYILVLAGIIGYKVFILGGTNLDDLQEGLDDAFHYQPKNVPKTSAIHQSLERHENLDNTFQQQQQLNRPKPFDLNRESQADTDSKGFRQMGENQAVAKNVNEEPAQVDKPPVGQTGRMSMEDMIAKAKDDVKFYCNNPRNIQIPVKDEGVVPKEYKLVNIHVILRHGDRSPIFTLPNLAQTPLSCDIKLLVNNSNPVERDFVADMKKYWNNHPQNVNFHRLGTHPSSSECEGAQLTGEGALQHLLIGRQLREVYNEKLALFGNVMNYNETYMRSTEYPRTWQSGVAFIYGFLPKFDPMKINIERSNNVYFCSEKHSQLPCVCPMTDTYYSVRNNEYLRLTRESLLYKSIKERVAKLCDTVKNKIPFVQAILDVINLDICHGRPPPCNKRDSGKCFQWALIGDMMNFNHEVGVQEAASYAATKMNRLLMHPLLHEIANRMISTARSGTAAQKFVLYSGHDKTVGPMAHALGFHDGSHPPYASRIIFELYKGPRLIPDSSGFFMKVIYNGDNVTNKLRFCEEENIVDGLCPLEYFTDHLLNKDMQFFGKKTYQQACQSQ